MRSLRLTALIVFATFAGLAAALTPAPAAPAGDEARRCTRCDAAIAEKLKVVVTDFAAKQDHSYCNVACAIAAMMERFPTARAVAHDPFAGKEVRIIRTGARWVAWPKSAVFLYLGKCGEGAPSSASAGAAAASTAEGANNTGPGTGGQQKGQETSSCPTARKKLDPALRCLAFPRQVEYIQYLATHPEAAAFKPRPLRLAEVLEAVKEQQKREQQPQ